MTTSRIAGVMPSRQIPVGVAFQDFLLQQGMHPNSSSGVIYPQRRQ
jgi:hypothetical protein